MVMLKELAWQSGENGNVPLKINVTRLSCKRISDTK
jgi:hypothetical protein